MTDQVPSTPHRGPGTGSRQFSSRVRKWIVHRVVIELDTTYHHARQLTDEALGRTSRRSDDR